MCVCVNAVNDGEERFVCCVCCNGGGSPESGCRHPGVYACVLIMTESDIFFVMFVVLASFRRILGVVIPVCSHLLAPYCLEP